ncbi:MAG: tRNA lysidine(34) synthetase TilS, partial [Gammaproteobacteria bacterium RIFOXYB2_FULL_38_6]
AFNLENFQQKLFQLTSHRKFLVAYSGGLDSHVLLYSLMQLRKKIPAIYLRAVHVHHGLSANADHWAAHCEKICSDWQIDFILRRVQIKKNSSCSIEALAREMRYQTITDVLEKNEVLLTAHNQNDQAETILLQLIRGAGPRGLAAMPEKKLFGSEKETELIRPLLSFSRKNLQDFAEKEKLNWIEDESNQLIHFDRNYLRQEILPSLEKRWSGVIKNLSRSAEHSAESFHLLDETADQDLQTIEHQKNVLAIFDLLKLSSVRQKNVLRRWLHLAGAPMLETLQLEHVRKDLLYSKEDAQPKIKWQHFILRRYQHQLFLEKEKNKNLKQDFKKNSLTWDLKWEDLTSNLILPNDVGKLSVEKIYPLQMKLNDTTQKDSSSVSKQGDEKKTDCRDKSRLVRSNKTTNTQAEILSLIKLKNKKITVRFRQGGEWMHPLHRSKGTTLKHLFQEWQIPPWKRNSIPLIFCDDQLIAVVGFDIEKKFAAKEDEEGVRIRIKN